MHTLEQKATYLGRYAIKEDKQESNMVFLRNAIYKKAYQGTFVPELSFADHLRLNALIMVGYYARLNRGSCKCTGYLITFSDLDQERSLI